MIVVSAKFADGMYTSRISAGKSYREFSVGTLAEFKQEITRDVMDFRFFKEFRVEVDPGSGTLHHSCQDSAEGVLSFAIGRMVDNAPR